MMFNDGYCIVDGNPCEQGKEYCSDNCRELDLMENQNVFFNGDEALDSLTESTTYYESPVLNLNLMEIDDGSPTYLLYECCLCNAKHNANAPCLSSANYRYEPDHLDLNHGTKHPDSAFSSRASSTVPSTIYDALKTYTADDDSTVTKSNLSIQHNYRKWLVMGS